MAKFRKFASTALAGLMGAGLLGLTPALADPIKIESENITFYGDVDPKLAQEMVKNWEIYRRMVFALSGIDRPAPDKEKLTVYGFYDTKELQTFMGARGSGVAGVYTYGVDGPIFLTSVNDKYTDDGFSEYVGLHEYTHHVMHALVSDGFPRWYDEGFANYLATMEIADDLIKVGVPSADHLRAIERGGASWISPQTVLGAIDRYPTMSLRERMKGGTTSFYAQSWLYVNYLRSTPKYKGTLGKYVRLLDQPGMDPLDAFEQAHGISVDDFHKEAVAYYDANKFPVEQYQPKPEFMKVKMKGKRISEAELAYAEINGQFAFLNDKSAKGLSKNARAAQEKYASDARIQAAYVALDATGERYDDAISRAEAALAGDPTNPVLLRAAGTARLTKTTGPVWEDAKRYDLVSYPETQDANVGIAHLEKLLAMKPEDYYAIVSMIDYYGKSDMKPTPAVLKAAEILDAKYMDNVNSGWGMDLAMIYGKAGNVESACNFADIVRGLNQGRKKRETGNSPARLADFDAKFGADCKTGEG